MKPIICTEFVKASPDAVFAVSTDVERFADVIKGIESAELLTPGPVGVGTRFKETRIMMGKKATEEMTFVSFEPGKRYAVEAESCGTHYHTEFRFTPEGGGTRIEMEFQGTPLTFMAKVMGAVMGPLMSGTMKKLVSADLADVKRAAEAAS